MFERGMSHMDRAWRRITSPWRRLPQCIIAGAQKAGTTSLFGYLSQHPGCAASSIKEVHYFDMNFGRGSGFYRSHFPIRMPWKAEEGLPLTFESSPYYLFHPAVPDRIRALVPEVKLVFLLRDPVTRAFSHYRHNVVRGRESRRFAQALDAEAMVVESEERRLLADPLSISLQHIYDSYATRGLYARQLERWFRSFPKENILVLESERLFCDPRAVYHKVVSFLGLPPVEASDFAVLNQGEYEEPMDPAIEERLRAFYAAPNRDLVRLLGWTPTWAQPSS